MMPCPRLLAALGCVAIFLPCRAALAAPETTAPPSAMITASAPLTPALCRSLAAETDQNLRQHILLPWYPRALDEKSGGFFEMFDEQWMRPAGTANDKSIVYQSRLTWVASQAVRRYPKEAAAYRAAALHGVAVLENRMWDREKGGFYWSVSETNVPVRNGEKHAYGIAFAVYAAAAAYKATGDAHALDLAKRGYAWLEAHAHDAKNGGYYEALDRDGRPILTVSTAPDAVTAFFMNH